VYHATLMKGDMIWIPANTFTLETVSDQTDVFGVRWAMICKEDTPRYNVFKELAANKMTASSHVSKRIVELIDLLSKST
jgi:hypothetical protein